MMEFGQKVLDFIGLIAWLPCVNNILIIFGEKTKGITQIIMPSFVSNTKEF